MSSRDLATVVKTQKAFIKELLDRLEGKKIIPPEERPTVNLNEIFMSINGIGYSIEQVDELLNDKYFNGLTLEQILELAKKSIRITADNSDLRQKIEKLLEKAKLNGDNFYANELKEILNPLEF